MTTHPETPTPTDLPEALRLAEQLEFHGKPGSYQHACADLIRRKHAALSAAEPAVAPAQKPSVDVLDDLAELSLLNRLIKLGAEAAHAHAKSNSDDGHAGTVAYVQWQELRAEMGELIRKAYSAAPTAPQAGAESYPPSDAVTADGGPSNVELRGMWYGAGGTFHGPSVETGSMPEAKLLPFLRSLIATAALRARGAVPSDVRKLQKALISLRAKHGANWTVEEGQVIVDAVHGIAAPQPSHPTRNMDSTAGVPAQAGALAVASGYALGPLPTPDHSERIYGGEGNETVHGYFSATQMREYARQAVYQAEHRWSQKAPSHEDQDDLDAWHCEACCGKGWNWESHQVAERKSDQQEFKTDCPACSGTGWLGPDAERAARPPQAGAESYPPSEAQRFTKKPVTIQAIRWTGENADEVQAFLMTSRHAAGGWVKGRYVEIGTLEGVMNAHIGDWIIKGVKGELYPCKPEIFDATYGSADATAALRARGAAPDCPFCKEQGILGTVQTIQSCSECGASRHIVVPGSEVEQDAAPTVQRMAEVMSAMLEAVTTQDYQDAADDAKELVAQVKAAKGQEGGE